MPRNADRPETNFVQQYISGPSKAPRVFGEKTARGETPIVLIPRKRSSWWRLSIPDGCFAIVSKRGASKGVYKPGFYILPPWYTVSYMVTSHYLPYHFEVNESPTKDNVRITADVDFLIHISDPEAFCFNIGPENMEELLRATQAESVRSLVRTLNVNEAYDLRGHDTEDMLTALNDKLNRYGITVDQVTIANVKLPEEIALSMQRETTFDSKQREQVKKQKLNMTILNDKNQLERVKQERRNDCLRAEEEAKKRRVILTNDLNELKATKEKEIAEVKAQMRREVNFIQAEGEAKVEKLDAERNHICNQKQAIGKMEAERISVENDKVCAEIAAKADVVVANNDAKALCVKADAEEEAKKSLKSKRTYELNSQRIDMWRSLAHNKNAMVSGESGDSMMQLGVMREGMKIMGLRGN